MPESLGTFQHFAAVPRCTEPVPPTAEMPPAFEELSELSRLSEGLKMGGCGRGFRADGSGASGIGDLGLAVSVHDKAVAFQLKLADFQLTETKPTKRSSKSPTPKSRLGQSSCPSCKITGLGLLVDNPCAGVTDPWAGSDFGI